MLVLFDAAMAALGALYMHGLYITRKHVLAPPSGAASMPQSRSLKSSKCLCQCQRIGQLRACKCAPRSSKRPWPWPCPYPCSSCADRARDSGSHSSGTVTCTKCNKCNNCVSCVSCTLSSSSSSGSSTCTARHHACLYVLCALRLLHFAATWICMRCGGMLTSTSISSSAIRSSPKEGVMVIYHALLTFYQLVDLACVCLVAGAYLFLVVYVQGVYEAGMQTSKDRDRYLEATVSPSLSAPAPAPAPAPTPAHNRASYTLQVLLSCCVFLLFAAVLYTLHGHAHHSVATHVQQRQKQDDGNAVPGHYGFLALLLTTYAETLYYDTTYVTCTRLLLCTAFILLSMYGVYYVSHAVAVYATAGVSFQLRYTYLFRIGMLFVGTTGAMLLKAVSFAYYNGNGFVSYFMIYCSSGNSSSTHTGNAGSAGSSIGNSAFWVYVCLYYLCTELVCVYLFVWYYQPNGYDSNPLTQTHTRTEHISQRPTSVYAALPLNPNNFRSSGTAAGAGAAGEGEGAGGGSSRYGVTEFNSGVRGIVGYDSDNIDSDIESDRYGDSDGGEGAGGVASENTPLMPWISRRSNRLTGTGTGPCTPRSSSSSRDLLLERISVWCCTVSADPTTSTSTSTNANTNTFVPNSPVSQTSRLSSQL